MSTTPVTPGNFCWFELATTDQTAGTAFYRELFSWEQLDESMGPMGTYTHFKIDGKDVAAACTLQADQLSQGVPPHWMLYIKVASADAAAAKITAGGGTLVVPPFDLQELGRMAVVSDPGGAMFCIWEAKSHAGVGLTHVMHTVGWADLSTPDVAGAMKFYGDVFGWTFGGSADGAPIGPNDYAHIINGDEMIGGMPPAATRHPDIPPNWMIYFEVADCAATVAKARDLGAIVQLDTMAIGENGSIAVLADPQGAVFALHQA
jgi:predicted enzyme related to lactoylglutathione lyase